MDVLVNLVILHLTNQNTELHLQLQRQIPGPWEILLHAPKVESFKMLTRAYQFEVLGPLRPGY